MYVSFFSQWDEIEFLFNKIFSKRNQLHQDNRSENPNYSHFFIFSANFAEDRHYFSFSYHFHLKSKEFLLFLHSISWMEMMHIRAKFLFFVLCQLICLRRVQGKGDQFRPDPVTSGPWVRPTKGQIWPKPRYQITNEDFVEVDPNNFKFEVRKSYLTLCY